MDQDHERTLPNPSACSGHQGAVSVIDALAKRKQIEDAVRSPAFSHARHGTGCWRDVVWIYHRDENSPSGVKLAVGGDADVVDPIIRAVRNTSALSPTER